ncbi:MAG TPA: response regulator [Terriglobales bacterium]
MADEQQSTCGPVLVIEDSWHDLVLMTHVLDDLDLKGQVTAVHSGAAALERIANIESGRVQKPAAIILDLSLPDISAEQLIAEIRRQSSLQDTPVIVFSDGPVEELQAVVDKFALQGCCEKPADFDEFQKRFAELLQRWIGGRGEKSKSADGVA